MAAKLIRVDCSTSCIPLCRCGWRGAAVPSRGEADRLADRHRLEQHRAAYLGAVRQRRHRLVVAAAR